MGKFMGRIGLLLLALVVAAGCATRWQDSWPFSTANLSQKAADAPPPDGTDADGKPLRLGDYRGKVVLLSFWMTHCPPCQAMFPHEKRLVEKYHSAPFALLGVNADSAPELLRRTQTQAGLTWPSFWDGPRGPLCDEWKVDRFPTFVLLDAAGKERWRHVGVPPEGELENRIGRLLAEPPGLGR